MSLKVQYQSGPFIIIHNHRKAPKLEKQLKKMKRQHHDYSTLPHSIIVTRRMAAKQQQKKQQAQKQLQSEHSHQDYEKQEELQMQEDGNFFEDQGLDRCIPIEDLPQEDVLYNLNDPTLASNYSKLERTLYGIGITAYQEDIQESQK